MRKRKKIGSLLINPKTILYLTIKRPDCQGTVWFFVNAGESQYGGACRISKKWERRKQAKEKIRWRRYDV